MLALLIAGLLLALFGSTYMYVLGHYPGYVLLRVGDFAIEMNLWFLLSAVIIACVLLFIVLRVGKKLVHSVFGSVSWLKSFSGKKADRRAASGLKHYVEGDWQAAKKELTQAAKSSSNPLLNYLAAAQSASELGQLEERDFLLAEAEKYAGENDPTVLLTQARNLLQNGQPNEAKKRLATLPPEQNKNLAVLDLHCQISLQTQEWQNVLDALPKLKQAKIYNTEQCAKFEVEAWTGLLDESAKSGKNSEVLRHFWKNLPKDMRNHARLLTHYVTALHKSQLDEEAEPLIKNALKHHWNEDLLAVYGSLKIPDTKAQLHTAESWLKNHSGEASLYFVLGKLCLRNELWGKARDYFEKSLLINKNPEVYAALGDLMAKLGQQEKSVQLYREGLKAAMVV